MEQVTHPPLPVKTLFLIDSQSPDESKSELLKQLLALDFETRNAEISERLIISRFHRVAFKEIGQPFQEALHTPSDYMLRAHAYHELHGTIRPYHIDERSANTSPGARPMNR
jgi:hypothetical protein